MAVTVTATASGAGSANGIELAVRVVNNASYTQTGTAVNSTAVTTPQLAITPGHAGNWVYGCAGTGASSTAFSSLDANTTSIIGSTVVTGGYWGIYRSSGVTTTSSTTYGWAAPTGTSGNMFMAAAEIQANGTLAEDVSTPAVVSSSGAKTITTASFTPPQRSVLVAVVLAQWTGSGAVTLALSDSASAYTWTQLSATPTEALTSVWVGVPSVLPSVFTPAAPKKTRGNSLKKSRSASTKTSVSPSPSSFVPPKGLKERTPGRKSRETTSSGSPVVTPGNSPGFLLAESGDYLLTEAVSYFSTEVPAQSVFFPPTSITRGKPAVHKGRSPSSAGSPVVLPATASSFTPPGKAAKGHPAATRARQYNAAGSPVVPGPVAPFTPPVEGVKGKAAAVKSKSIKSSASSPPVPSVSPFTPPVKPSRGKASASKAKQPKSSGSSVVPGPVSPFEPPVEAVKGKTADKKSRTSVSAGTPVSFPVPTPSPFVPPQKAVKGDQAVKKSRQKVSAGSPVAVPPSPFTPPVKPAKGKPDAAKAKSPSSRGSAFVPGPVAPFTPPVKAVRGDKSASKSRVTKSPGAPVVTPSPFYAPVKSTKGDPDVRKSRSTASSGSPVVLPPATPSHFYAPSRAVKGDKSVVKSRESASKGTPVFIPPPQALFTATGTLGSATANGFTLTPASTAFGEFILLWVTSETAADFATAISGTNMKWSVLVPHRAFTNPTGSPVVQTVFIGQPLSTSGAAQTITFSAGSPTIRVAWQEFNTPAGFKSIFLDATGFVDTASNGTMPVVTPTQAHDMYAGYVFNSGTGAAGTTTGYTYQLDPNTNQFAYNLNASGSTQTPNIGDTGGTSGIGVMLAVSPQTSPPPPPRKYSKMRRSRTNRSAVKYSVAIPVTVPLSTASSTATAYPLPAHAIAAASVTANSYPLVPVFAGYSDLAVSQVSINAHTVTASSTPHVNVNLTTAQVTRQAYLANYTPPVLVYLQTAKARQGGIKVGPPNPLLMTVTPGSGVDDYGNPYSAGFHIYSGTTNGSRVSLQSTNDTYGALPTITYTPPAVSNVTLTPQSFGYVNNAGSSNQAMFMIHTSGKTNSKDDAAIQLVGAAGDNSTAAVMIFEFGGTVATALQKTGGFSNVGWTTATLINGWTGGGGIGALWYRFNINGEIEVLGDVINTTATGNSVIATLPSPYRGPYNLNHDAGWNNSGGTNPPWIFTDTGGNIQATGISAANHEIFFHLFIPVN